MGGISNGTPHYLYKLYKKEHYTMELYALPLIFLFAFGGGYAGTYLAIKISLHNAKVRDEWKARSAELSGYQK